MFKSEGTKFVRCEACGRKAEPRTESSGVNLCGSCELHIGDKMRVFVEAVAALRASGAQVTWRVWLPWGNLRRIKKAGRF